MELQTLNPDGRERRLWMGVSVAVHCVLLLFLTIRPEPVYLKPSVLMKGDNGKSMSLVYVAPSKADADPSDVSQTAEHRKLERPRRAKAIKPQPQRPVSDRDVVAKNESPKMGVLEGTAYYGAMSGHDVRPALPIVSPDPPVDRADLQGLEGDVIVEVTIDTTGDVIQTKLLQGFAHGVEDKVISVVQRWKFKPATLDGVPIASRQDVHFHYPS